MSTTDSEPCPTCKAAGYHPFPSEHMPGAVRALKCSDCNGTGRRPVGDPRRLVRHWDEVCHDPAASAHGSAIPFENNKGNVMKLDGKLTIADLVKMGVKEIRLMPEGSPLADNWWRDAGLPNNNVSHE